MTNLAFSLAFITAFLATGCKAKSNDNGEVSDVASAASQNPICRKAETWDSGKCGKDQRQVVVTGLSRIDPEFSNSLVLKGIILCYGKVTYYRKGEPNPRTEYEKAGWKNAIGVWLGYAGCYTGTGYRLNDGGQVTGANVVTPLSEVQGELHLGISPIPMGLVGHIGEGDSDWLRYLCTKKSEVPCELVNEKNTLRIKPVVSR